MSIRFQADANLDPSIIRGLLRREPSIDFQLASTVFPPGTLDSAVLQIAADSYRVLVSLDVTTMPIHFERFISERDSPGVILIPSHRSIRSVIEALIVVWASWPDELMRNQVRWLPSVAD